MFIIVSLSSLYLFLGGRFCICSLLSFEVDSPFSGSGVKVRKSRWFLVAAPPKEAFFLFVCLYGVKEVPEIIPACTSDARRRRRKGLC